MDQAVERKVQLAWPPSKRSRTGYEAYSTLRTQDCDEVKLWNTEVRDAQVHVLLGNQDVLYMRHGQRLALCKHSLAPLCLSMNLLLQSSMGLTDVLTRCVLGLMS